MKRSYTEETRDQIIRNPLNDSTSKTSYSFGKSQRFKTEKNICPHVAYDINLSTNRKRKASFGYGKRTDFVMSNQFTPAPLTYSIDFVRNKQKEGFSFGANREQTANGSYIPLGRLKNPGPGNYESVSQRNSKDRGYTMRPKTAYERNYFIENKQLEQRPGPGNYEVKGTIRQSDANGLSKFKHLGVPNFDARTSKRFSDSGKNPGPGTYFKNYTDIEDSAFSRNKSIGRETRTSFTESAAKCAIAPGVGSYKLPTDFGHYRNIIGL